MCFIVLLCGLICHPTVYKYGDIRIIAKFNFPRAINCGVKSPNPTTIVGYYPSVVLVALMLLLLELLKILNLLLKSSILSIYVAFDEIIIKSWFWHENDENSSFYVKFMDFIAKIIKNKKLVQIGNHFAARYPPCKMIKILRFDPDFKVYFVYF